MAAPMKKPVSKNAAAAVANFLKNKSAAPAKKPAAAPMVADTDADEE